MAGKARRTGRDMLFRNRYEIKGCMAGRKPIFKTAMTAAACMRRSRALRCSALTRIADDLTQAPTALLAQALVRQIARPASGNRAAHSRDSNCGIGPFNPTDLWDRLWD